MYGDSQCSVALPHGAVGWSSVFVVKELGFWKLTWHNCPAKKGLTSEIVRTTLQQHF